MLTGYETYQHFHALRLHFKSPKFDFTNSGQKIRVKQETYQANKAVYLYVKFGRECGSLEKMIDFVTATYAHPDYLRKNPGKIWIYDFVGSKDAKERYAAWKGLCDSQLYHFEQDFAKLTANDFICDENSPPEILNMLFNNEIKVSTLININRIIPGFFDIVAKHVGNDFVTPDILMRLQKLRPFIPKCSIDEYKKMGELFQSLNTD
jgi:hypothetical protein